MTWQTWRLKKLFQNESFAFNMRYEHFYNLKLLYSGYLSGVLWYKRTCFLLPISFKVSIAITISPRFISHLGLEFAYRSAPKSMQSLVMAFYFVTHSLGSLLGSGLLELSEVCHIVKKTRKHEYYSHTYYFFLLCVLMLLSWSVFVVFIKRSGFTEENYRHPRLRDGIRSMGNHL